MNTFNNNSKPLTWFMGLLLTAFVAGCSGGGDGGGGATAQPGTLGVSLTDAPACGFDLPFAAPQYAVYRTTLPLLFAPSLTTVPGTGKFQVDALASGYTSKSIALVDIGSASQVNMNFALLP